MNDERFDIVYYMTHEQAGIACYREEKNNICLFEYMGMYGKQIEPDYPDMVCSQNLYYGETLGIKETGKYLKYGGIGIGVWEYYKEDGTLDHTENRDEHFPITWNQLEQIMKDKDISLLSVNSIFRHYDEEKDTATWSIVLNLPMNKGCVYIFDARTGEIISKEIISIERKL